MAFSRICLSVVCALTGKWPELSTPNLLHVYSIVVAWHAISKKVKGQGHTFTKTITVAWLLVTCAATAIAGVGLHVDTNAYVL